MADPSKALLVLTLTETMVVFEHHHEYVGSAQSQRPVFLLVAGHTDVRSRQGPEF